MLFLIGEVVDELFFKKSKKQQQQQHHQKSLDQCNLKVFTSVISKNRTINSYPKCRAISSAAPFRNLNCPRSLFYPNNAFFAATSP